jgi:sugar transferase (PEP-CTERM system associated)
MQDEPTDLENREQQTADGPSKSSGRFFAHSTQLFRHHIPTEFVLLGIIESALLVMSLYIGIELRFEGPNWQERLGPFLPRAVVFCGVLQLSLIAFGIYQRQPIRSINILAVRIGGGMLAGTIVLTLIYYLSPTMFMGRGVLALSIFVSFIAIMASRLVFMRIARSHDMRLRVLVLGAGKSANLVREAQSRGDIDDVNIIAYMPMPGDEGADRGIGFSGTPGSLSTFVNDKYIDVIVLAMDERRSGLPIHELLDCKMGGVEVIDLLTLFERHTSKIRLDIMQPSWLFLSDGFQMSTFRRMWKRAFDITFVLLLLPLVLPIVLLASCAILIESRFRDSVFYSQTRVGEGGKLFQIYKFRSMVVNAEHDGVARWADKNDDRITWVGGFLRKFRIDELPQLYNILVGDMSFVGPRPERPEFVQRLTEKIPYYNERHRVRPGLSGWAQIRYPYGASEEDGLEKLQYDLYYVKNYSILLDALVLLQTAEVVLLGRGSI